MTATLVFLLLVMSGAFLWVGNDYRRLRVKHRRLTFGLTCIISGMARRDLPDVSLARRLNDLRRDNA